MVHAKKSRLMQAPCLKTFSLKHAKWQLFKLSMKVPGPCSSTSKPRNGRKSYLKSLMSHCTMYISRRRLRSASITHTTNHPARSQSNDQGPVSRRRHHSADEPSPETRGNPEGRRPGPDSTSSQGRSRSSFILLDIVKRIYVVNIKSLQKVFRFL